MMRFAWLFLLAVLIGNTMSNRKAGEKNEYNEI